MELYVLYQKALQRNFLSENEGLFLYEEAPTSELMLIANKIRKAMHPAKTVTWLIDRNVNITNVCVAQCAFCNFHRKVNDRNTYITSMDEYRQKIDRLMELGGNQLLLQGGLHPRLKLDFYVRLFSQLKTEYPNLKLHALGPPEIVHLARMEKKSYREILEQLIKAGLDSLPGAGAEILSERVRKSISPGKCSAKEWLDVMRVAHSLNLQTSATMMFGHVETNRERIQHLIAIRDVQYKKSDTQTGFMAFIPWPFQDKNTKLNLTYGIRNRVTTEEYVRMIAISRIMLPNIPHIQASWLTVGKDTGQISLHAGANDFGSIMIEENVVSAAGADYKMNANGIQEAISEAGFIPQQRNGKYEYI